MLKQANLSERLIIEEVLRLVAKDTAKAERQERWHDFLIQGLDKYLADVGAESRLPSVVARLRERFEEKEKQQ